MSLMSYITSSSAQGSFGYGTSLTSPLGTTSAITGTTSATATSASSAQNSASISKAALIAAAEADDNKKDFTALSADVRAALDAATAAGAKTPDLSEMSGRALAAIILNKNGSFTSSEQVAAKAELRQRTKDEFASVAASGGTISALSGYDQQLVSDYDAMSPEERQVRGWTSQVRDSAASFVSATTASSTGSNSSLFDLLNNMDDSNSF
jgi:hypothetical protein